MGIRLMDQQWTSKPMETRLTVCMECMHGINLGTPTTEDAVDEDYAAMYSDNEVAAAGHGFEGLF